jgi:hypothetical protein
VIEAPVKKVSNQLAPISKEKCGSTWVNGGNYVLVAPKTCDDVAVSSMIIAVSDKPCGASTQADFQSLTYNTHFKGDFGFHLGQASTFNARLSKRSSGNISLR